MREDLSYKEVAEETGSPEENNEPEPEEPVGFDDTLGLQMKNRKNLHLQKKW